MNETSFLCYAATTPHPQVKVHSHLRLMGFPIGRRHRPLHEDHQRRNANCPVGLVPIAKT